MRTELKDDLGLCGNAVFQDVECFVLILVCCLVFESS